MPDRARKQQSFDNCQLNAKLTLSALQYATSAVSATAYGDVDSMSQSCQSAVTTWLLGVENQEPFQSSQGQKRKAEATATSPRKRFAKGHRDVGRSNRAVRVRAMPASKGRGRVRADERIPLNDTTPNALRLPRRSSRRRGGRESPHKEHEALTGPLQNVPELPATSSRHSTTTSAQSRSTSPRKLTTLAALPDPIVYVKQDPYSGEPQPPAHVQDMWDRVKDYARGRRLLPRAMQEEVQRDDRRDEFGHDCCFDDSGVRQELGEAPPLTRVEEIRQDTTRCKNRKTASEDVWNDVSHVPIGQLACRYSADAAHVRWQNVKSEDIAPRACLLPTLIAMRPPDAARADYAIVLEPTPRLKAALPFLEPLPGADDPSWAPTLTADVIHCPFASVMETKKDGGDPQKAEYQLGIWAYAIFKRLRLLLEANGQAQQPLPCLPLFMVEGERWDFYIASQGADAKTVR